MPYIVHCSQKPLQAQPQAQLVLYVYVHGAPPPHLQLVCRPLLPQAGQCCWALPSKAPYVPLNHPLQCHLITSKHTQHTQT